MPAAVAAGIAQTALAAPVVGGLTTALGTGLALGSGLAASGGIAGLMGGMGALGGAGTAGSVMGALAPGVASTIAPAAASQLAGTIGASAIPGLQGGMGALAPGATSGLTSSALQSAGLNTLKSQALQGGLAQMPAAVGGYNPAMAQNLGAQFMQNAPPLAKPFGAEAMLADTSAKITPQSLVNAQGQLGGTVSTPWSGVQPYQYGNFPAGSPLHAGNITSAPTATSTVANTITPTATPTTSPYDLSAGFKQGIDPRFAGQQSLQTATGPMVDPTSMVGNPISPNQNFMQNLGSLMQNPSIQGVKDYAAEHPYATAGIAGLGAMGVKKLFEQKGVKEPESNAMIRPYTYDRSQRPEAYAVSPTQDSSERLYFNDQFIAGEPYKAAGGGIVSLAAGGPVEQMSAMNAIGANTGYPMANINSPMYSNPMMQRPEATNVIAPSADAGVGAYTGEQRFAKGGVSSLGGYSDGGRLLRGPGDGVSDSIPASIGGRQPARLADGEFVVPARIVSELGNGSTEAGARKLYAMMDRIQKGRRKSVGKGKVAVNSKADKHLPV